MNTWEARKQEVKELITELNKLTDERSKSISAALQFYGFAPYKMPHREWIKIRKQVMTKAKAHLVEVAK